MNKYDKIVKWTAVHLGLHKFPLKQYKMPKRFMLFSINTHFFDNSYRIDCNFATTAVSLHYYVYEYEKKYDFFW